MHLDTLELSSTSALYVSLSCSFPSLSLTFTLSQAHRGVPLSHTYLSTPSSAHSVARITLVYSLPLSSIITNFHSTLKSLTSGFASFDYEEGPYERGDLCRMNILVNSVKVDALCSVLHRSAVQKEGRDWAKRLREVVPRQQYEVSFVWLPKHSKARY